MEDEISRMKTFLVEFKNDNIQTPTSDEIAPLRIVNYDLDPEDVTGQVIDWVLNYLDNRKCPYTLAVSIAKEAAQHVSASLSDLSQTETESSEKSSNSTTLYSDAISMLPAICNSFLNQGNLEHSCTSKYATSVFAIKNKRRKMEDRYVIHHDLNAVLGLKDAPHHSYYAVFDGHSGIDAACYASAQLHINIAKHPDFLRDTSRAIVEGYQTTDLNFLNKCNKWHIKSGCTAVSALIRDNTVYLSWLGDSQAALVKEGVPITVTNPHKPDREDEKQRIESLGGHVSFMGTWRVNGLLAVTRAIGDPDQKRFISGEPEMSILNLDGTEDFLILACDGLWDGMSPEEVTGVLYRYLADSSPEEPLDAVAAKLVHQSKLQGSEDNITVIVVFLRDIKIIKENAAKFVSNSSYCIQGLNFMSMNGSMKSVDVEHGSEASFSKPTVLELNAASSKKLKNAANVMSSAGFGSTSYNYQYVENTTEAAFHSLDSSAMDTAQNVFCSQNVTASCFAPEATALSELPTPPIDDMLASQQYENFYSTDLYKEFSNSMHSSQIDDNIPVTKDTPQSPILDSLAQPINNITENVSSVSLQDKKTESTANSDSKISSDEAVGIASTVVSTAIETAVKCISSETQDSSPTSPMKLNPYAKPFVMKSFCNVEESESKPSDLFDSLLMSGKECNLDTVQYDQNNSENKFNVENTNAAVAENIASEQLIYQSVGADIMDNSLKTEVDSSYIQSNSLPNVQSNTLLNSETVQEHLVFVEPELSSVENAVEISKQETGQEDKNLVISNSLVENFENIKLTSNLISEVESDARDSFIPDVPKETNLNSPLSNSSVPPAFGQESFVDSILHSSDSKQTDLYEFNQNTVTENTTVIPKNESKHDINKILNVDSVGQEHLFGTTQLLENFSNQSLSPVNMQSNLEIQPESPVQDSASNIPANPTELGLHAGNNLCDVNVTLKDAQNDFEVESKKVETENLVVGTVEKNIDETTTIPSEPISLLDMKNELIPVEAEVPSDPSVDDSHAEAVAVDLKSLPAGIPEAEGVTEDIDSDSEKDGGWSYMKGNIVSGSKSKTENKTPKSNDVKSNITPKGKKDVLKPNFDIKSKMKNTVIDKTKSTTIDKSKSSTVDKSKTLSADKLKVVTSVERAKAVSADKTKNVSVADKTAKTLPSADKVKKVAVEKKPDIKTKSIKSTTVSAVTKVTAEKTSRIVSMSSVRKETTEATKTSSTVTKTTRPTTLVRANVPSSKPTSTSIADRNTAASKAPSRPKIGTTSSENKPALKTTLSKGPISAQVKTNPLSTRVAAARPATTIPSKASTIAKSTTQKCAIESKPKQPISTMSSLKKPATTTVKKSEIKEVKDNVNKQISAKKNTTATKVDSSSTLSSRRIVSTNLKSATTRVASSTARSEGSKKDVPKTLDLKSAPKPIGSSAPKAAQQKNEGKEKKVESAQSKTEETKNSLNLGSDQKNITEIEQVAEEKFILETSDKEIKEKCEVSVEEKKIEGNLTNCINPVEDTTPTQECTPENL